jgi:hypothetical protein
MESKLTYGRYQWINIMNVYKEMDMAERISKGLKFLARFNNWTPHQHPYHTNSLLEHRFAKQHMVVDQFYIRVASLLSIFQISHPVYKFKLNREKCKFFIK